MQVALGSTCLGRRPNLTNWKSKEKIGPENTSTTEMEQWNRFMWRWFLDRWAVRLVGLENYIFWRLDWYGDVLLLSQLLINGAKHHWLATNSTIKVCNDKASIRFSNWESKRCEGLSKVIWCSPLTLVIFTELSVVGGPTSLCGESTSSLILAFEWKHRCSNKRWVLLISIGGSEAVVATPRSAGGCQYCTQSAITVDLPQGVAIIVCIRDG